MICSKCRNDNPGENRFCGHCGARLRAADVSVDPDAPSVRWLKAMDERKPDVSEPVAVGTGEAEAAAREREVAERAQRAARRERELARLADVERARERGRQIDTAHSQQNYTPPVGGPSFLGLNESYPQQEESNYSERADIYGGGRSYSRALWLLLVLLLVAGLVYLQWRHSDGLQALPPAQKAPAPPSDTVSESQEGGQGETLRGEEQAASSSQEAANSQSPQAGESSPDRAAASDPGAARSAETKQNQKPSAPGQQPADVQEKAEVSAQTENPKAKASPIVRAQQPSADESDEPVRLAERYLLGRGLPQSCEQATTILREAAHQGNYRAQIKLGALYATGNCVSLDRVQAYRFFTRALRSKPANTWVEQNRSMLWAQMSEQERQQAMEQSF